jgi:tetratricopeptide (TPR) repeat protein
MAKRRDWMNIPFNMTFHFNKELREVPNDKKEMLQGIQWLKTCGESNSNVHGLIGVYARIVEQLDESEEYLRLAIEHADNEKSVCINELRLAHTYQWKKQFQQANSLFQKLFHQLETSHVYADYKDFLFQHYGKNLFDQGLYGEALKYFQKALEIRFVKGDPELIASVELAIEVCTKKRKINSLPLQIEIEK